MNLHRHSKQRTLRMACFHLNLQWYYVATPKKLSQRLLFKTKMRIAWSDWCTRDVGSYFSKGRRETLAWSAERVRYYPKVLPPMIPDPGLEGDTLNVLPEEMELNRHPTLNLLDANRAWLDAYDKAVLANAVPRGLMSDRSDMELIQLPDSGVIEDGLTINEKQLRRLKKLRNTVIDETILPVDHIGNRATVIGSDDVVSKRHFPNEHSELDIAKAFLQGDGVVRRTELRMIELLINKNASEPNAGK